jgi:ATP-binding cassette, subfamily C, bacterial CydC
MKLFLRLLKLLLPFGWQIALAIFLGCVTVASNIGLLGMAAYLIAAAAIVPFLVLLTLPIYIVQFMGVLRPISRYMERLVAHDITFRLLARLRSWVYSRLEPLSPAHLLMYRSGDMLTRLVSDVEELQNIYLRGVSPLIVALLMSLLTFELFSIFSPVLAWTALAFLLTTAIGIPLLSGMLTRGLGKQQLALRAELNAQVVDGIQGVQDLLVCGRASDHQRKIADLDRALGKVQQRMAFIAGLQQAMNNLFMNLAMWTLLLLAIPLVVSKAINGVYLGFLALVILASFEAVQPLAQAFQFLGHSLAAGERVFGVIDATPQVVEPTTPLPAPAGHILEFDDVHFTYHTDENEVVNGVSFTVQSGRRVAIVGPSGSGKSTLLRLALRFWDPTHGTIRLDGQDIRQYALGDLRKVMSVVDQDIYLFNGTLRDNLLLARPKASQSELDQVLEQAQLIEYVRNLSQGLETWVGEQGLQLSGGERQRLAIARALLKNAPLLILDEVTANLDPLTERAVLDVLMRAETTLMITHRLIAMDHMDEILVLDSGRVRERGTHAQLLETHGLYQQLFDVQNGMLNLA